ncbi:mobilization protein [Bacteroidia bacterium]|nr:mobilization protein [Bacteroidia bacterium]
MVADIHIGNNLYGALAYNQEKIDAGLGKILETNRVFVPADGQFSVGNCMRDFERAMPGQVTTTRGIIHISLNPHPEDKLTDEQLADIGREYMEKLGFGGQPWMIFKHEDIDRQHLHIVSTRVRSDGSLISDRNNYEKSRQITDDLEKKYALHPKDRKQGEAWQLSPVDALRGDLKKQVANAIKPLVAMYRFQSLGEYRALLSLYNIGVEKVEGNNQGHQYTGLVYSALDAEGNRVGKPLKSSLFGKQYGIEVLEQMMKKSGEEIKAKGIVADTRATVSASMTKTHTGSGFRVDLQEKGIDLVLRYGNGGRLFGVTFIDHNSRTVLNGSALGKEFSANALSARFADFAQPQECRENLQLVTPIPVRKSQHPVMQPADEKQPQSAKGYSGDNSPIGSLLSVLTPEPDQHDTNEPAPKRKKKKKRRYGRQG